jgi:ATP-binding cassette subfamily F protein 3
LQNLQAIDPKAKEQDLRNFLGRFHFNNEMALEPIRYFSGGEKARLALAKMIWQAPGLLILDEPTNHLDIEMRTAIEMALQTFSGAVILISHDRHLLKSCVNDFYLIHAGKLQQFPGDLDDYQRWLQTETSETKLSVKEDQTKQNYRDLKALQAKIKRLERDIENFAEKLSAINERLYDETLYQAEQKPELDKLIKQKEDLERKRARAEDECLECMLTLEDQKT